MVHGLRQLGDQGFAATEQAAPEQRGERQVGAEVLDEKDQRHVLAQGRPQPDDGPEHGQVAAAGEQRMPRAPQQQADGRHDRRNPQQYGYIGRAFAGAAEMGEQRPGDKEDDHGQAAQQLGRANDHWVRWLAM